MSKDSTPNKRLKESEWIVISALWERGEVTLRELSDKFGISDAALSQGLKRRGIKRGAKAHVAYEEIAEKHKEEREKLLSEVYSMKRKFIRYGDFLMTLTMNEITEAKKASVPLATRRAELDTIKSATQVYKTIRNDMFHLYELYNKDDEENTDADKTPEFNIGVYSNKDLEELREAQDQFAKEWAAKHDNNAEQLGEEPEDEEDDSNS